MSTHQNDVSRWKHYLQDERDAAFLYSCLAQVERNETRRVSYAQLANVESKHVDQWEQLIAGAGGEVPSVSKPSFRARILAWIARRFGTRLIAPVLLAEESREVKKYLQFAREVSLPDAREMATEIARESAQHAGTLAAMLGKTGEPWHAVRSGGVLRSVIYGFNDGLTANFGLIAGMLGASVDVQAVLIAGIAGLIADALSMGSSGYLAAKSEAEVYSYEIAMEREEIELMPATEAEELAIIYQAKGMTPSRAQELANTVMLDPVQMLGEKVREELAISPASMTPLFDGVVTGSATAAGAFIPVLPFLLFPFYVAIWVSFVISMIAHFGVGAARSLFTGRGILRSGFDMFVVGFGVAAVGYVIGDLVGGWLPKGQP